MKIVLATRNTHKLREIRNILNFPSLILVSPDDFPLLPDIEEDSDSFAGNAVKKAVITAMFTKCWALADDSGLEVDCLAGAPGVRSARYAGEPADYEANNKKLLRAMSGESNRDARFVCVIAMSSPSGRAQIIEGFCRGSITTEPRGSKGFGYDPVFIPEGHYLTFGEIDEAEKNSMSHRSDALEKACVKWRHIFMSSPGDWDM